MSELEKNEPQNIATVDFDEFMKQSAQSNDAALNQRDMSLAFMQILSFVYI